MTPEQELEEVRRRLIGKVLAGLEEPNPKASFLAVAAKLLTEESTRLDEAKRRNPPSTRIEHDLPFPAGENASISPVPVSLPFPVKPLPSA